MSFPVNPPNSPPSPNMELPNIIPNQQNTKVKTSSKRAIEDLELSTCRSPKTPKRMRLCSTVSDSLPSNIGQIIYRSTQTRDDDTDEKEPPSVSVPKEINRSEKIVKEGKVFNLTFIGNGDYKNAYRISSNNEAKFFAGYENSDLVIKCYSDPCISKNSSYLVRYSEHQMHQLEIVKSANLCHAPVLNDPLQDHYFVSLFIPNAITFDILAKWKKTNNELITFNSLDNQSKDILEQLKVFFTYAIKNNIPLDLSTDNLRLDRERKMHLVDLKESDDEPDEVIPFIKSALKAWSCGNTAIYGYLINEITDDEKLSILNYSLAEYLLK